MLNDKVVLVTGGTGSFGRKFTEHVLARYRPRKLIIFSRDELKQHEMRQTHPDGPGSPMRYFIGDVRDLERMRRAFQHVDVVVHAAALKQVPACEYNPFEAVQTNILGTKNVIEAALDQHVTQVLSLSTDKAVNPVNLYGATKLSAEKITVQANVYAEGGTPRFSACRYGNVVGSRGSVIPLFEAQRETGTITITDPRMTRFWITLRQGVEFVVRCLERMQGGEVFVPKIPSMTLMDLARVIAPDCKTNEIGIRPGEKLHEILVSEDEARKAYELDDSYVVLPAQALPIPPSPPDAKPLDQPFRYTSDENPQWLTPDDLRKLVQEAG